MPYKREGAQKISDHHVRSPMLNVNRACQTCHRWSEDEMKSRVETIQARTFELRNRAMDAVVALINDLKAAKAAGKTDAELRKAQALQRRAQFMLDFVEAENSTGFHAPQEAARILATSADLARQGQVVLRDPSFQPSIAAVAPVPVEAGAHEGAKDDQAGTKSDSAGAKSGAPGATPGAK